ncbi:hypothetical protein BCU66_021665 [Vibrio sp. 10N.286.49.B1]|uniref:hypothetical protein n=1 Tax=unclassified Vibrio TaxID=2614977 RepID=UPI001054DBB3|nr:MULTISPECIES: hypothetical protein [unclassified Vibrio]
MRDTIIMLFAALMWAYSSLSYANPPSGDLHFSGHVREHCGVEVLESGGELAFGQDYTGQESLLRLENNRKQGRIRLKLKHADFGDISSRIPSSRIRFQIEFPQVIEGDIDYWRDGVVIEKQQLNEDQIVRIKARINIEESLIPAGELVMRLEWSTECVR